MIWLEMRCGLLLSPVNIGGDEKCWSYDNAGPHQMSSPDRKSILSNLSDMEKSARAAGWVRTKEDGWVCPVCKAAAPAPEGAQQP